MKKRKKLNIENFILFLLITFLVIFICINFDFNIFSNNLSLDYQNISKYDVIKQDKNDNYSGIGQEKIDNKDGYFTTFTTIENKQKIYKEYKQNGISSWSNNEYWGGIMAENGCGITAMAIILSGYNKDFTPEDLREKYYPVLNYDNLSNELYSKFGIKSSGFYFDSPHLSDKYIIEHLNSNRPIIICVWNNPTENRWTTSSHYMVLLATDNMGKVYISNPNRW